jgi:hypothetical protein
MRHVKKLGRADNAKRVDAVKGQAAAEGFASSSPVPTKLTYSVREIADRFEVTPATVLQWIRSGELKASNVSRSRHSKRPRYRVTHAALEAFEASRAPAPQVNGTRGRNRPDGDVIRFFPTR